MQAKPHRKVSPYCNTQHFQGTIDAIAIGQSENGLDKQKELLAELLNQNPLYVDLSEIDEEGRALNRQFYGESSCKWLGRGS